MIVAFWIVLGIVMFAAALAAQMRMLIAETLARCVAQDMPGYEFEDARPKIRYVRHEGELDPDLVMLRSLFETRYAQAWGHMKLARWGSVYLLPVILVLALIYRFFLVGG